MILLYVQDWFDLVEAMCASMTKIKYKAKGSFNTYPSQQHRLIYKTTTKHSKISSSKPLKKCDTNLFSSIIQYNHASNNLMFMANVSNICEKHSNDVLLLVFFKKGR
jgi:hypothetical protein